MDPTLPALIASCFALWLLYRRFLWYFKHRRFHHIHHFRPPHAFPQYKTLLPAIHLSSKSRSWIYCCIAIA